MAFLIKIFVFNLFLTTHRLKKIEFGRQTFWAVLGPADTSSFYCSDINLFLIDYAWCELRNVWLLLFGKNSRSITIQELNTTGGKALFQLLQFEKDKLKTELCVLVDYSY